MQNNWTSKWHEALAAAGVEDLISTTFVTLATR